MTLGPFSPYKRAAVGHNFKEAAPGVMTGMAQKRRWDVSKFMAVLGPGFVYNSVRFAMQTGAGEKEVFGAY